MDLDRSKRADIIQEKREKEIVHCRNGSIYHLVAHPNNFEIVNANQPSRITAHKQEYGNKNNKDFRLFDSPIRIL